MSKLLPIGTTIYTVEESISDRWFSEIPFHYEVVSGEITRINKGGYSEYVVQSINRLGRQSNLLYLKTSNLGKSFFTDKVGAVELAEKVTDEYEKKWRETLIRPWRDKE